MMLMMPLLLVVVVQGHHGSEDTGQGEDVCSVTVIASAADVCSQCLDTTAVVVHDDIVYCASDPKATISNSGKGITYQEQGGSDDGDVNTKWWKNIYPCEPDTKGNCHDDDDDDDDDDDTSISIDSEDEEGEDVCSAADDLDCTNCVDTAAVVSHEGMLYCVKDPKATVSKNGKGISYTETDGDTNTKFWKNINQCAPTAKGYCHFDKDDIPSSDSSDEDTTIAYYNYY